jgi:hypothetical protein
MDPLDEVLAHYGVKGMRWGVRKGSSGGSSQRTSVSTHARNAKAAVKKDIAERRAHETTVRGKPGQMVRVVGGNKHAPHDDAVKARISEQIAKKSTLDALGNKDLQHLVNRMNLEQQYRNLAVKETRQGTGEKVAKQILDHNATDFALAGTLGPHAAMGKVVLNHAFGIATRNKAMSGGVVKDEKSKKEKK